MQRTLWLVGMPGAGKSAVGVALARRLGTEFADADARIVAEAGRGIPELFAEEGEACFRARERSAVSSIPIGPLRTGSAVGASDFSSACSRFIRSTYGA